MKDLLYMFIMLTMCLMLFLTIVGCHKYLHGYEEIITGYKETIKEYKGICNEYEQVCEEYEQEVSKLNDKVDTFVHLISEGEWINGKQ